jgi:simple sugar transport system permease protein
MDKVKDYVMKNLIGLIVGFTLFVFIFILPGIVGSGGATWMVTVIALIGLGYITYKAVMFRRNNPSFKMSESTTVVDIFGSIIAVIAGLFFGYVLMLFVNPAQATPGIFTIIRGGFRDIKVIGNMIYFSVPLILTGLSVAFAFKTGLFNIGASGQLTMGAFVAVYIGVRWTGLGDVSPFLHWATAALLATVAGALWGAIPGLLKAYRNVNEVVASIMLNYLAMYLNTLMIKATVYNPDYATAMDIAPTAETPTFNLEMLFPNSSINAGIIVAVLVVIILHILLHKTTFGYELRAVGFNRDAARYAGMNSKRNIVFSMVIAGAVAGLAGAMMFLDVGKNLSPQAVIIPEGFTGIAISLLGLSEPIGVLIAGLFYGSLQQGGYYLQLLDFKPEIIDIIIAVIIYASALGLFLQKFVLRTLKAREMKVSRGELPVSEGSDE